ncbi:hypothetical protein IRP63_05185 [Clostridium botulinum]|uniref:Peptidase S1 domain-containing protein n=1 Tax=Clostridium botulinum C/D str. DC5 TaxID=1443128 RepID=A0A0A0IL98_CLOBO|nr:hypothetical protein [Clostridium botulinum]KGM96284.1 hypothetical protein Z956_03245 [Clostridium botulinum D str. CCUG 7971]KGN00346.1 hypothetical protein Z955_03980 [Clostridium botulinum C/D str. DC5]KOC46172.1 hypothetical protein ADU88_12415 [Clostridium botulinum]KOC51352.1 hypothetical protein ADU89_13905 [Clostridium botulinum]KOC53716.1 hypothetical protein ADU90_13285 [Clostridium botulinum]
MVCNCCSIDQIISYICENEYQYFFQKKNVVGVGVGYKVKGGFCTNKKSLIVFVSNKISSNELSCNDLIPPLYRGIITDVMESGTIQFQKLTQKSRPVEGGFAIGVEGTMESTTMGCLVTDGKYKYVLTTNHGIVKDQFAIGRNILQPSPQNGGKVPEDIIGTISKFIPLKYKGTFTEPTNLVDCCMIIVLQESLVSPKIHFLNTPPLGVANPELNIDVQKIGSATEKTIGKILSVSATMKLEFNKKDYIFKKQIVTTKMTGDGDSGAIVLNMRNFAVGMAIGGSQSITVVNNMANVLKSLNVNIVTH